MKRLFFFSLFLIFALSGYAESDSLKIFVATNGNDANSGTFNSPLQSFGQAVKTLCALCKAQPPKNDCSVV